MLDESSLVLHIRSVYVMESFEFIIISISFVQIDYHLHLKNWFSGENNLL
jgi:hypothetical protein